MVFSIKSLPNNDGKWGSTSGSIKTETAIIIEYPIQTDAINLGQCIVGVLTLVLFLAGVLEILAPFLSKTFSNMIQSGDDAHIITTMRKRRPANFIEEFSAKINGSRQAAIAVMTAVARTKNKMVEATE